MKFRDTQKAKRVISAGIGLQITMNLSSVNKVHPETRKRLDLSVDSALAEIVRGDAAGASQVSMNEQQTL